MHITEKAHTDELSQKGSNDYPVSIKRIFKQYYFERNFEKTRRDSMKGGDMIKMRLKEGLKPKFGKQLLPRFKRKNLRSNPFDPDGNICD